MDDCLGDEVQAKKQYNKIMQSIERQQQKVAETELRKPSAAADQRNSPRNHSCRSDDKHENEPDSDASASSDESSSQPGATTSDSESELEEADGKSIVARRSKPIAQSHGRQQQLRWSKPGVLSQRVGVSQSVLRNWADTGIVQSMVSAGGHRLFNVKSVERHIAKAAKSQTQSTLRANQRQIIVYVRLNASRDEAQMQAAADTIGARLLNKYKDQSTENEQLPCKIIVDLEEGTHRTKHNLEWFSDTLNVRQLLQSICNHRRCDIVLQAVEDISAVPSTYAFFLLLCKCMGSTVHIVPDLCAGI